MPGYELIDNLERKAVNKLFLDGGVLFAHGFDNIRKNYHVREFEDNFGKKLKVKYSLAVSSGTAAIKIALKALGVKPGDEVITQSFNFIATIEAILDIGAVPRIINIDNSYNMNLTDLKKNINKKTKVLLPVHMLGVSAEMNEIKNISNYYNLKILEDNCEALGARYGKKFLGTIGDIGVFSFDFGKTVTTGEGGMIVTNNPYYYNFCKEYHDHGHLNLKKQTRGNDKAKICGFNYRMTEMQAVVGKVQLKKLDFILKESKIRYEILKKNISKNFSIREIPLNSRQNYDVLILSNIVDKKIKEKILKCLKKKGFGTKNLPGAIKWHCSYYWNQAIKYKKRKNFIKTKKILSNSIAIPILLKKSYKSYNDLGKLLNQI
jgi:8-amino-3,8-dideoxy-alpha-D-manno-octulosonate transaminase